MTDATETEKTEIRERIERVYLALTDPEDRPSLFGDPNNRSPDAAYGALTWFREQVSSTGSDREVAYKTVQRWASGERTISTPALRILENLEREAGLR